LNGIITGPRRVQIEGRWNYAVDLSLNANRVDSHRSVKTGVIGKLVAGLGYLMKEMSVMGTHSKFSGSPSTHNEWGIF
jgi:hypothetical protein